MSNTGITVVPNNGQSPNEYGVPIFNLCFFKAALQAAGYSDEAIRCIIFHMVRDVYNGKYHNNMFGTTHVTKDYLAALYLTKKYDLTIFVFMYGGNKLNGSYVTTFGNGSRHVAIVNGYDGMNLHFQAIKTTGLSPYDRIEANYISVESDPSTISGFKTTIVSKLQTKNVVSTSSTLYKVSKDIIVSKDTIKEQESLLLAFKLAAEEKSYESNRKMAIKLAAEEDRKMAIELAAKEERTMLINF